MNSNKNLNVSVIIPIFSPAFVYGGPIFSSYNTCNELSKLNVNIYVSTTNAELDTRIKGITPNIWIKKNDNFLIKYYNDTIINKFSIRLFFSIWKDILFADIVHIQTIFRTPIPLSLFLASVFNKPILLTPRGSLGRWCVDQGSNYKQAWLKYFIKPFLHKIVWHATAEMEKNEIINIFPNAKVIVIPNGFNTKEFDNYNIMNKRQFVATFAKKDLDADQIIVSMARLHKIKGFDILIDSFSIVVKKFPKAKLLIAGQDEGEKDNLERQIKSLGLDKHIFLVGQLSGQDKIDFFVNADVFALPSHNENFGIVYAESLAAATPIIASTNTPWEEVETNSCGKCVPNSVESFSDAIIEILESDVKQMGLNGRKYIEKYDWKNIATQFKHEYEKLLDEHTTRKNI